MLPLRKMDMYRLLAALVAFTVVAANLGCAQRRLHQKESNLRRALVLIRSEIAQFTLDKGQPPASLAELVTAGYMKEIPVDPFTGKNDTWKTEKRRNSFQVRSGSDGIASDGTRYSSR